MDNRKLIFTVCSILFLALAAVSLSIPRSVFGQATIPTRTPKPQPTDDDNDGGGGGNKPNPTSEPAPTDEPTPEPLPPTAVPPTVTAVPTLIIPTETIELSPSATPPAATETPFAVIPAETPTVTVTAAYFELGGETVAFPENNDPYPQAGPCELPPTFTAEEAITIYAGPGTDYPLAGLIGEEEVRPIVGRAAFTNWWIIQLDESGRAGWVSDELGTVHGYTGRVPIISAPDLNGVAPTPGGDIWAPTPPPCDAPELLASAAVDEAAGGFDVVPPSGKPDSLDALYDGVVGEASSAAGSAAETTGDQVSPENSQAESLLAELAESAQPLDLPTSTQQLPNLMPVAGLVLILAAVIIGVFARRGRSSGDAGE